MDSQSLAYGGGLCNKLVIGGDFDYNDEYMHKEKLVILQLIKIIVIKSKETRICLLFYVVHNSFTNINKRKIR